MAKAVVVLSPPQAFSEAFLHFCRLRLQVSDPVLLYSHSSLKGSAKLLASLLQPSAVVNSTRTAADYLRSIREVASRQGQDCVFLLCGEEMQQLCTLEGALQGTLGLQLSPNGGLDGVITRDDFQAYLHSKMSESWRGETPPKMNLQMHLAAMRETILTSLQEELSVKPCDYTAALTHLQGQINTIVDKFVKEIEETQSYRLEKMRETAETCIEEAKGQFEKALGRVEVQVVTLVQEQSELVRLLAEAGEALREAKLLKVKLASYEEANKATQQLLHSLRLPAKPPIPSPKENNPKPGPPSAPLQFTSLPNVPAMFPPRLHNEPPPVSKTHSVEIPRGNFGFKSKSTAPQPSVPAFSSSSVEIEEIIEGPEGQDCLVVRVRNTLDCSVEGASLVIAGAPPRLILEAVPPLPPGKSQFLAPADCLSEDLSDHIDFFLRKGSAPISASYTVSLDHAEVPSAPLPKPTHPPAKPGPASTSTSGSSVKKEGADLTPEQHLKFQAALAQLGGFAQPIVQEKIRLLVQDPANASLRPEQLLDKVFS